MSSETSNSFVKPNDPILLRTAEEIPVSEITSEATKSLIEGILTVAFGNRKDMSKPTVVGLAAPQIGISKRIIAVDIGADGKGGLSDLRIYLNPQIVWRSDEESEWYEGCWSTDRVCGVVSRPKKIKIEAYNPKGEKVEEEHEGYVGRIFQHEIDHLNGNEFVTHITDNSKLHWVEDDEFPEYRNNEGWRNWPKKCPRERWNKIKGIKD